VVAKLIPVDIVTGFLGSGKTTLIQHVLEHGLNNQKVAVIVNDLAEYNIDGQILTGINVDQMVQRTSNCLCCSGIRQMGLALQEITETADPLLILIETSGASAPGPVIAELTNLGYRTDALIAVVDAGQFLSLVESEPVMMEQVMEADFIVLNKIDLASPRQRDKVRHVLRKLNRRASLVETVFGRIETDLLFATGMSRLRKATKTSPAHEDDIEHFAYETKEPLDRRGLERVINKLPKHFYRAKGFLRLSGNSNPWLLNYTCGRYTLEPFSLTQTSLDNIGSRSQLVFVGRNVKSYQHHLKRALDRCASSTKRRSFVGRLWNR
jgi:G3E family GTPase